MTEQEAIKEMMGASVMVFSNEKKFSSSMRVAMKALEDVEQYRAIGTVEECRAAVEIIRYMIQEGIEPEVLEAYVWFEDELAKKGFTVKSVLEAREKQTAAKPLGGKDIEGNEYAICRECSAILSDGEWFAQYCPDCGQKLDWREKEQG